MLPCTAAKGKVSSTLAERADAPETDQGRTWRDDEPQCLTQPPHRAHAAQADRAHGTERRSERSMWIFSRTHASSIAICGCGERERVSVRSRCQSAPAGASQTSSLDEKYFYCRRKPLRHSSSLPELSPRECGE